MTGERRHLIGPNTPRIPCHGGPLDGELQPDVSMRLISPNWEGHYRIATDAEGRGVSWEWDRGTHPATGHPFQQSPKIQFQCCVVCGHIRAKHDDATKADLIEHFGGQLPDDH